MLAAYEDLGGGQAGEFITSGCDFDDGTLELVGFATGRIVLVETGPPPGYSVANPRSVRVVAGATREVTVVNKRETGAILVHTGG